jgi:hypothetical protein
VTKISMILPPTLAMNALNSLAMGHEAVFNPWGSLAILFSGGVLAFALAIYLFNWDRHNDMRRGHPVLALLALTPYIAGMFLLA